MEKKWYVVRAISGKEKKVKELIENEIRQRNLQEYISQVLIPTEKVYQIRNGKKISKERNFFPGYILIEAALVGEIPHIIRNLSNVIGFLSTKEIESVAVESKEADVIEVGQNEGKPKKGKPKKAEKRNQHF